MKPFELFELLKRIYYLLSGKVYIEKKLLQELTYPVVQSSEVRLLHISDTPQTFFPALAVLIREVKPDVIIHTGDLVDNIKLQLYPASLYRYENEVRSLIAMLEASAAKEIYIALGNHDNGEFLKSISHRIHYIDSVAQIQLQGVDFTVSHYSKFVLSTPSSVNLYGHDLSLETQTTNGQLFLNGISSINLLSLPSKTCRQFPYPWGTDDNRLGRGKLGF